MRGLTVEAGPAGSRRAVVSDLSFDLTRGETLCLAGESGSGKSMTALALMGLLPKPGARLVGGSIRLGGAEISGLGESRMREIRGDRIAMIFQEPMTSLNPVLTIGRQVTEAIRAHRPVGAAEAHRMAIEALDAVRIPQAGARMGQYPHELSGGQRQRVMIAMALALKPDVLLADEPTTALDVTVQAQVLGLLKDLQRDLGTAVMLITHDMGVVAEMADRVIVMRHGLKVEEGEAAPLFSAPRSDYARALLAAVPRIGSGPGRVATRDIVRAAPKEPRWRSKTSSCAFPCAAAFFGRVKANVHAVEGVSFQIRPGETLALVGESGCGKSTTAKALAGLAPYGGDILVGGRNIGGLDRGGAKAVRRAVQMIFQDPYASLDPRMTVGDLVREPLDIHDVGTPAERRDVGGPAVRARGPDGRCGRALSARILGRPAAAHLHRPRAGAAAERHHRRRKRLGSRRLHPGEGAGTAARVAGGVRHRLSLHQPRHGGGREHLRPGGGNVCRPHRRDGDARPAILQPHGIPIRSG